MNVARDIKGSGAYMNLPNKLTLGRIFLVPFIIVFLVVGEKVPNYTAGAIFLAAVLTDWLDGRIARNTRQVTALGKLLDPIADKLLISTALIALVQVGRAPAWMVVLIVGRELAITGLRTVAASQSVREKFEIKTSTPPTAHLRRCFTSDFKFSGTRIYLKALGTYFTFQFCLCNRQVTSMSSVITSVSKPPISFKASTRYMTITPDTVIIAPKNRLCARLIA